MRENKKGLGAGIAGLLVMIMAVIGVVAEAAPATASLSAGSRVTGRWSGAVHTWDKASVNSAYWSQYAPKLSLPIDWLGGSILGCLPGLSALSSNNATLSALNYVRSLAGLAPVTFSAAMNAAAQRAALMMDANDALSHDPSSSWRCWSQTGATAASKSNLALAWPSLKSGQIIDLYMNDIGGENVAVGHRRWVLNPFSTVMGTGSTSTANALTVIGPTSSTRPNPRYVAWPTQGYFPTTMEPSGRWSLSAGLKSVSFGRARVAVYRNGVRVPATKYPIHNGYAQPTLVWQLAGSVPKSGNFKVVVTRIHRRGIRRALSYTYKVNLFTPYH
jgi:uncharacterized protein YkwD